MTMLTRRHFVARSLVAVAAGCWGLPQIVAAPVQKDDSLYILHTNDTHSRLKPFPDSDSQYGGLGGAARRAHFIRAMRRKHPNMLLLDSGDFFQGTPFFNMFSGEPEIKVMSLLGYDATTLGNHDFDLGVEGLDKALRFANFPILSSNYATNRSAIAARIQTFKVFRKSGWKIGVFGLGINFQKLVPAKLHEPFTWVDPIETARTVVADLKRQGADLIICLSHLGYKYGDEKVSDRVLAAEVDGIDLILGGHTHTFLDEPETIQRPGGKSTVVGQDGCFGVRLGIYKATRKPDLAFNLSSSYQTIC